MVALYGTLPIYPYSSPPPRDHDWLTNCILSHYSLSTPRIAIVQSCTGRFVVMMHIWGSHRCIQKLLVFWSTMSSPWTEVSSHTQSTNQPTHHSSTEHNCEFVAVNDPNRPYLSLSSPSTYALLTTYLSCLCVYMCACVNIFCTKRSFIFCF